jgi:hypothetical protein
MPCTLKADTSVHTYVCVRMYACMYVCIHYINVQYSTYTEDEISNQLICNVVLFATPTSPIRTSVCLRENTFCVELFAPRPDVQVLSLPTFKSDVQACRTNSQDT